MNQLMTAIVPAQPNDVSVGDAKKGRIVVHEGEHSF